jgi:Tol biopolymer transport system component
MTEFDLDFDRQLSSWLEDVTPSKAPEDVLDTALARVASVRQRPGWLVPERWTLVESTMRLTRAPRTAFALVILALVLLAIVAALTVGGVGARLFSPTRLPIVFTSSRDGVNQIVLMAADGTGQTVLTTGSDNSGPAWSRDGLRLAFVSKRDGHDELYTMNADGSNQTRLTNSVLPLGNAAWSPDGRRIAYNVDTGNNGCYEIFMINADGSGGAQLTPDGDCNWAPDWSPDGSRLVFSTTRDGLFALYTMRPDGSNQTLLENAAGSNDAFPMYSPDGSKIAFTTWDPALDATSAEIAVVNADGTGRHALTSNSFEDGYPAWSPDGTRIVFMSRRDGSWEVYSAAADGSSQTRLTTSPTDDTDPAWR